MKNALCLGLSFVIAGVLIVALVIGSVEPSYRPILIAGMKDYFLASAALTVLGVGLIVLAGK